MLKTLRLLPGGARSHFCRGSIANASIPVRASVCAIRRVSSSSNLQDDVEPFRKVLKETAKARRQQDAKNTSQLLSEETINRWELTVGIEVHAQLNANCKLFSGAKSAVEEEPNSFTAVFDLAYPGSQPIFQLPVLVPALRAALALNCQIQERSTFDRKHYFYQDQPAGYQITQYYNPFALSGEIELFDHDGIAPEDGKSLKIGIKQIQMEQDTAKSVLQPPDQVLLDFNRVGHPLIEIISLPQIHHPKTAAAYVRKISQTLLSVDAVTTGMELGGLRADVNVSVHRKDGTQGPHSYAGVGGLGQRTEIKNLSSYKAVEDAIIAERNRQIQLLENGGEVLGETRGWSLGSTETTKLRGKEGEVDYRYMPDPDISPVFISRHVVEHLQQNLPTLPDSQLHDLTEEYGISIKDAKTLIALEDGIRVQYFHSVLSQFQTTTNLENKVAGKLVANWVLHELGGLFSNAEEAFDQLKVSTDKLAQVLKVLHENTVTGKTAKQLLSKVFNGDDRHILDMIKADKLAIQRMTPQEYRAVAQEIVDENPDMASKVRNGQKGKLQWFVGQMMRKSKGTMIAKDAQEALEYVLDSPP